MPASSPPDERDLIVAWLRRLAGDVDARGAQAVARIVRALALAIEDGKHEG